MTVYTKRLLRAMRAIGEQQEWIRDCGGDLAGYTAKYGSAQDTDHYGDGAEAIYAADRAELKRLDEDCQALIGRQQQFGRGRK